MLFEPLEVFLYAPFDLPGFAHSILLDKPSMSIMFVLVVIAAAFTVSSIMAQRNNISWHSPRALRTGQRYPVIHCEGMPQSRRSTANGATIIEIKQASPPIIITESDRKVPLASIASLSIELGFFVIVLPPVAATSPFLVRILLMPNAVLDSYLIYILPAVAPILFPQFFSVLRSIVRLIGPDFVWVLRCPQLHPFFVALFTRGVAPVFGLGMLVEIIKRFQLAAMRTAFSRGIHSVSLSLYHTKMATGGVIGRFSGATLDAISIIPQRPFPASTVFVERIVHG